MIFVILHYMALSNWAECCFCFPYRVHKVLGVTKVKPVRQESVVLRVTEDSLACRVSLDLL